MEIEAESFKVFRELGERGLSAVKAAGVQSPQAQNYVAGVVLQSMIKPDMNCSTSRYSRAFSLIPANAEDSPDAEEHPKRFRSPAELGDATLIHTGIFARSLQHFVGGVRAYEHLGRHAYHVASLHGGQEWGSLYHALSESFMDLTRNLREEFREFTPINKAWLPDEDVIENLLLDEWRITSPSAKILLGARYTADKN